MTAGGMISFQDFYPQSHGILPPVTPGERPVFGINPVLILINDPSPNAKRPDKAAPPANSEQDPTSSPGGAIPLENVGAESSDDDERTVTGQPATMPVVPQELQTTVRSASSDAWRQTTGVTGEVARAIAIETESVQSGQPARFAAIGPEEPRIADRNLNRHTVGTPIHEAALDFLVGSTPVLGDTAIPGGNVGAESKSLLTDTAIELNSKMDYSVPQSWLEKSMVDSVPDFLEAFAEPPEPANASSQDPPIILDTTQTTDRRWVEHVQAVGRAFKDFGSKDGVLEISGLLLAISLERGVASERRRRAQSKTTVSLHKGSH
jgi:hypothetical protein